MAASDITPLDIVHLPTPLEAMPRLRALIGKHCPPLYIKRDDCTGLGLGGNKSRKLTFLLADALASGATRIVTQGALQSNHVRQTAAASARLGLPCDVILSRSVPIETHNYNSNGNMLLTPLYNVTTHIVDDQAGAKACLTSLQQQARDEGDTLYFIPTGGSNSTGALGYVRAVEELMQQWASISKNAALLVHASASGGTQAGLVAGVKHFNAPFHVQGVNVYKQDDAEVFRTVAALTAETLVSLGNRNAEVSENDISLWGGAVGEGYGLPTAAGLNAVADVAAMEGILLDPVYTGKAMGALLAKLRAGAIDSDLPVIFIHTGGSSALHAYQDALEGAAFSTDMSVS